MRITNHGYLKLWLSANDTYNWAHKYGASWPCSQLSGRRLFAEFDQHGNLVDVSIDGKDGDCDCNEFNAITSDFIATKYPAHPAIKSKVSAE